MDNEQNKYSQNAAERTAGSPYSPQGNTGQNAGAAVAKKKDALAETDNTGDAKTDAGKSLLDQAKDTAGQAYDAVAEKANTKLEEHKNVLSTGLTSVANSVRKVGENLKGEEPQDGIAKYTAEYSGAAADKIDQAASYFERKDVKAMYRDVENFARGNPAVFIGGAFALGILAARFLKSSSPKQLTKAAGQNFGGERSVGSGYSNGETSPNANQSSY